jgi:hypothetical protein
MLWKNILPLTNFMQLINKIWHTICLPISVLECPTSKSVPSLPHTQCYHSETSLLSPHTFSTMHIQHFLNPYSITSGDMLPCYSDTSQRRVTIDLPWSSLTLQTLIWENSTHLNNKFLGGDVILHFVKYDTSYYFQISTFYTLIWDM